MIVSSVLESKGSGLWLVGSVKTLSQKSVMPMRRVLMFKDTWMSGIIMYQTQS